MGFLERFAKLQSRIKDSGEVVTVSVFDDEISDDAIMWLDAYLLDVSNANEVSDEVKQVMNEENIDEIIHVEIVNFNDKLFFELPENKQSACATVVLRNFIKHYKQNYNGLPVRADFLNYGIQEKFKAAIEKGIFPEESLVLSKFITEEQWNNDHNYNMENREKTYNANKAIPEYFAAQGMTLDGDNMVTNIPVSQAVAVTQNVIQQISNDFKKNLNVKSDIFCNINGGEFKYTLPIKDFYRIQTSNLRYDSDNATVYISSKENEVRENEELFRTVFDTAQTIFTSEMNSNGGMKTIDEYFTSEIISSKIKRMIRKGE